MARRGRRRNGPKKRYLIVVLIALAVGVAVMPRAYQEKAQGWALSALEPVLTFFHDGSSDGPDGPVLANSTRLTEDGSHVEVQVRQLTPQQQDQMQAQLVFQQNQIRLLQAMLATARLHQPQIRGVIAEVNARKDHFNQPLLGLNKGTEHGVLEGAGVLYQGAVIGRIVSSGPKASSMALITNQGMRISARLLDSRVTGLLQGCDVALKKKDDGEQICIMKVVARDLKVRVGEHVVTSGLDGSFPAGCWLGVVTGHRKTGIMQWEIRIAPAFQAQSAEAVYVLYPQQGAQSWPQHNSTR